jgi:hypothetical protein
MSDRFGKIDKTAITVVSSFEEADRQDRAYWHSKTPQERLEALEQIRQVGYGYDPASVRIQRFIEVVEHP